MTDKKFREEYESIKAPAELYDRIVNAEKNEVKNNTVPFRKIIATAASFAVIAVTVFAFLSIDKAPEIYVGNQRLTGEVELTERNADGIMLARMGNEISCEVSLTFEKDTRLSITDGVLTSDDGTIILDGTAEKSFSGILNCTWLISCPDNERVYEMNLNDGKKNYVITLSFDSVDGQWTASLTE